MNILLVAPTTRELGAQSDFHQALQSTHGNRNTLETLVTGPGLPPTLYTLTSHCLQHPPDLLIHIGVAGAVPDKIQIGEVVQVVQDQFADIGAEERDGEFLTMPDLGLWTEEWAGPIIHPRAPASGKAHQVSGVTVNTIPGTQAHVQALARRMTFDIETMEGAGVSLVCRELQIPAMLLRGISNWIGPRDRASWRIAAAVDAVRTAAMDYLRALPVPSSE